MLCEYLLCLHCMIMVEVMGSYGINEGSCVVSGDLALFTSISFEIGVGNSIIATVCSLKYKFTEVSHQHPVNSDTHLFHTQYLAQDFLPSDMLSMMIDTVVCCIIN